LLNTTEPGEEVTACVVDTNKVGGIVELSLLPELTGMAAAAAAAAAAAPGSAGSKRKKQQQQPSAAAAAALASLPSVGAEVQGVVQVIKDHHVVVAVKQQQQQGQDKGQDGEQQQPAKKRKMKGSAADADADASEQQPQQQQFVALGFLARGDMNSQGRAGRDVRRFTKGQELLLRVVAAPAEANGARMLLEVRGGFCSQAGFGGTGGALGCACACAPELSVTHPPCACPSTSISTPNTQQLAQPATSTAAAAAAASGGKHSSGSDGGTKGPKKDALVSARVVAIHDWNMEVAVGKVRSGLVRAVTAIVCTCCSRLVCALTTRHHLRPPPHNHNTTCCSTGCQASAYPRGRAAGAPHLTALTHLQPTGCLQHRPAADRRCVAVWRGQAGREGRSAQHALTSS
jgi:hypothetical protein